MQEFKLSHQTKHIILALGAESAGNFTLYKNGILYFSEDFGDLLNEQHFSKFQAAVLEFLKTNKIKPDLILSDLHPHFHTTLFAQELAKKYKAEYIPVQHHLAHIFSALGEKIIEHGTWDMGQNTIGIACDGTGYGLDEKIWGGEIFEIQKAKDRIQYARIGHLENQILLGGELAIKEPARVLISILSKFLNKDEVYNFVKKYYSKNEFALLCSQLGQNFNCLETSSTARVLDAVSVLLGFSKNERLSKHGPVDLLEKNSTQPYPLKPIIEFDKQEQVWVLQTTPLFEYLIKNLDKDKKRLAATAQKYIADGLLEIRSEFIHNTSYKIHDTFFSGGMANNKIISSILESLGVYMNKRIPRGDAGISFGQIFYYLLTNSRH